MSEYGSYATVDDLEARWRPLESSEKTRAEALLADASAQVDLIIGEAELSDAMWQYVVGVVCGAVMEAMKPDQGDAFGLGQVGAWTPTNPSTRVQIDWRDEKKLKRAVRKQCMRSVPLCP